MALGQRVMRLVALLPLTFGWFFLAAPVSAAPALQASCTGVTWVTLGTVQPGNFENFSGWSCYWFELQGEPALFYVQLPGFPPDEHYESFVIPAILSDGLS